MRPMVKAVGLSVAVLVALVATLFIAVPLLAPFTPEGFDEGDLNAPHISYDKKVSEWTGWSEATSSPGESHSLSWWVTPVYSGYGGVINMTLNNTGDTTLHVYKLGIIWTQYSTETSLDVSVNVTAKTGASVGLISFTAPSISGKTGYRITVSLMAMNNDGEWWDFGEFQSARFDMDILPLISETTYGVTKNPSTYYEKVNSLVDPSDVEDVANGLSAGYDSYDIQEVIAAFDWVQKNIEYKDDPEDHWQSPSETLSLGTGDCEDQAMLVSAIVSELGGNARVNLIEGHAFATVYIGPNSSVVDDVADAISSHYGTDLNIFYLEDDLGIWMMLDTTSFPYCGAMPTSSAPTGTGQNDFTFEDTDYLYTIDVVD